MQDEKLLRTIDSQNTVNMLLETYNWDSAERQVSFKMQIKIATTSQLTIVKDITCQTIREIYPHYYPTGAVMFFLRHHSEQNILNDIANGNVYVIESMENIVGTITIKENEICRLFVLPQYQGNGYGRMLMDFAEKKISKQYEEIVLDASLPAKNIYLKRKYYECESKSVLTENGDFLCYDIMKKSVTSAAQEKTMRGKYLHQTCWESHTRDVKRMIRGISHITFIVHDMEKATSFFEYIFHAEMVYDSGEQTFSISRERFFLIGDLWIAIMQGNSLNEKSYNHVAFEINDCDFEQYENRVQCLGVEIKKPRNRISEEGRSIYFYDYDNHLFELHTGSLKERLHGYGCCQSSF